MENRVRVAVIFCISILGQACIANPGILSGAHIEKLVERERQLDQDLQGLMSLIDTGDAAQSFAQIRDADLLNRQFQGDTLLTRAIRCRRVGIVEELLNSGLINLNARVKEKTAFEIAGDMLEKNPNDLDIERICGALNLALERRQKRSRACFLRFICCK